MGVGLPLEFRKILDQGEVAQRSSRLGRITCKTVGDVSHDIVLRQAAVLVGDGLLNRVEAQRCHHRGEVADRLVKSGCFWIGDLGISIADRVEQGVTGFVRNDIVGEGRVVRLAVLPLKREELDALRGLAVEGVAHLSCVRKNVQSRSLKTPRQRPAQLVFHHADRPGCDGIGVQLVKAKVGDFVFGKAAVLEAGGRTEDHIMVSVVVENCQAGPYRPSDHGGGDKNHLGIGRVRVLRHDHQRQEIRELSHGGLNSLIGSQRLPNAQHHALSSTLEVIASIAHACLHPVSEKRRVRANPDGREWSWHR